MRADEQEQDWDCPEHGTMFFHSYEDGKWELTNEWIHAPGSTPPADDGWLDPSTTGSWPESKPVVHCRKCGATMELIKTEPDVENCHFFKCPRCGYRDMLTDSELEEMRWE